MGEGGIIVPPRNYFKAVKEVLDRHGILFIADEVQSGFGRTGAMFAIEHYGVEPDIMATAKGIADGFPLGCVHFARRNRSGLPARGSSINLRWKSGELCRWFGEYPVHAEARSTRTGKA